MKTAPMPTAPHRWNRHVATAGLSLVELVVFVAITAVLMAGIFSVFSTTLQHSMDAGRIQQAALLARERMELILGQRHSQGFAAFTATSFDPCTSSPPSSQPVCTALPPGYTITTALTDNWGGDPGYKVVTVTVTGSAGTQLTALVADY